MDSLFKRSGVYDLLVPNLVFDRTMTELSHAESADYVSPTSGYVNAEQKIVSYGEIVTPEIAQILDSYKAEYNKVFGYDGPRILLILGDILIALALLVILYFCIFFTNRQLFQEPNRYLYLLSIFTLTAVLSFLVERIAPSLVYLMPFTIVVMYMMAFFKKRVVLPVYMVSLLPLLIFSRRMLKEDAMVAGYPSVRQFCDTSAVMMSASDLFPSGCVTIEELYPLQQYRVNESLLMAAAVLREGSSPIAPAFDELVMENNNVLPSVESVMFEDKSGLVGWIGGERILIGNMKLMNRYHITVPVDVPIKKSRDSGVDITYVAISGQAVAILSLSSHASKDMKDQIQRAERSGLALIVSTTDANITPELIADRYGVFFRSVKVTAPGYSNVIDEAVTKVEETSRAYLATRGRIGSLARAIGGCIGLKSNISLGIVIEIFGMLLGILLSATLALYASVARLSIVELMIYIGFWVGATIIAELIKRP
ncbi:MAG: hypothetical protein IJ639_02670, partial [Ruminococcus sp.]|nr:hypothetical protein [Ruminococcus sp.]